MSMQMTSVNPPTTSRVPADAARTVVDLAAIAHNVRVLRDHAGSAEVMAVVKADAYGHGAARVAAVAIEAGAAELGVATIDEALGLRAAGVTAPVLAWLHAPGVDFAPARGRRPNRVSSQHQIVAVLDAVRRTGRTANVTLKVETGLNRNGLAAADFAVLTGLRNAAGDGAIRIRASCHIWRMAMCRMIR